MASGASIRNVDAFADRIFVREKLPGERFVDDRHARRTRIILRGEDSAADQTGFPWRGNNPA